MLNNIRVVKKTVVDTDNNLWNLEYDASDNTVEILSEHVDNASATLGQYSMDNALGRLLPKDVVSSAESMLVDEYAYDSLDSLIDTLAFDNMFED